MKNGEEPNEADLGEIDIVINNVVSTFFTRCHLKLKDICLKGMNVIYNQENKVVSMKLKKPSVTASIWSSGKITCAGASSEEESLIASRKVARCLWRLGFETKFARFKIVNVLGTVHLPFDILLTEFSNAHNKIASYEPELHPGVTFKLENPKASLKIFHTGSITIAAPSAAKVKEAMEIVYPLVYEYRLVRPPSPPSPPSPTYNNGGIITISPHIANIPPRIPTIFPHIPTISHHISTNFQNTPLSISKPGIININNNKNNVYNSPRIIINNTNPQIITHSLNTIPNTNIATNNPPIATYNLQINPQNTQLNISNLTSGAIYNQTALKRSAGDINQATVKKYKSTLSGVELCE